MHITDPDHVRALWEMGFFGKGTLSRSEPSWVERERARIVAKRGGGGTAEEATRKRREERRAFKLERARVEAEKVQRQRAKEEGRVVDESGKGDGGEADGGAGAEGDAVETREAGVTNGSIEKIVEDAEAAAAKEGRVPDAELVAAEVPEILVTCDKGTDVTPSDLIHPSNPAEEEQPPSVRNEEHLQLTFEEAFFLSYGLGVLDIRLSSSGQKTAPATSTQDALSPRGLLPLFAAHSTFPSSPHHTDLPPPTNPFLLTYAVYHHFRSLGWVIRPGTKFSCDYLLYNRGPVFSHAEFAVIILPSYSHPYWSTDKGMLERDGVEGVAGRGGMDWWWLHCVNRVQSQVKKSLVLCYVEVPPPLGMEDGEVGLGELLGRYKVREFVVRRWLMNRSRD